MMLQGLLDDIAHYQKQTDGIDAQIKKHTQKVQQELVTKLQHVPGIGPQSTEIILAEIGSNVDAFSNEDKLAAWVGLAPGNKESAGKAYYSGRRDGNVYLRTAMLQVAWSAVRTKNTYWRALYYHLTRRLHSSKAIVAIARKLIRVVYKVIKGTKTYTEYGADHFMQHLQQRLQKRKTLPVAIGKA